jgi:hypothetical protein
MTLVKEPKGKTRAEIKAEKRKKRKTGFQQMGQWTMIYIAIAAGVLLTESILDIERTQELVFRFSWIRVLVSTVVAAFFMFQFEAGGDVKGKQKNILRRVSHAFSQGAALRGIIEWLFLLFTLTR